MGRKTFELQNVTEYGAGVVLRPRRKIELTSLPWVMAKVTNRTRAGGTGQELVVQVCTPRLPFGSSWAGRMAD